MVAQKTAGSSIFGFSLRLVLEPSYWCQWSPLVKNRSSKKSDKHWSSSWYSKAAKVMAAIFLPVIISCKLGLAQIIYHYCHYYDPSPVLKLFKITISLNFQIFLTALKPSQPTWSSCSSITTTLAGGPPPPPPPGGTPPPVARGPPPVAGGLPPVAGGPPQLLFVLHQWLEVIHCWLEVCHQWLEVVRTTIDVAALQRQRQLCYVPDTIHCVWLVYNQTKVPLITTCQKDGRNQCPDQIEETGLKREPNKTAFRPRPPTEVPKKGLKAQKHTILVS
uniref:Uncharacterized protein n=2 Tax=Amphimedon queenslandica TaxID=400682 RepID=A0A1X7U9D2_AMPQE